MRNIPLPSRESCNDQQVHTLLEISQALQNYLLLPHAEVGTEPPKLDGGAQSAAAATFIGVCAKLDEVIADASRWSLAVQDELYASLVAVQKQQAEFLKAQTAAAEAIRRPAFQLRPVLATHGNEFLAIWGNADIQGGCIIGKGPTPEAAMLDFDQAFTRTPSEQISVIAEEEITPPQPTKPKKRPHGK